MDERCFTVRIKTLPFYKRTQILIASRANLKLHNVHVTLKVITNLYLLKASGRDYSTCLEKKNKQKQNLNENNFLY